MTLTQWKYFHWLLRCNIVIKLFHQQEFSQLIFSNALLQMLIWNKGEKGMEHLSLETEIVYIIVFVIAFRQAWTIQYVLQVQT